MWKRALRFIATYLSVSVLACAALLVDTWPLYPRSILEWALLLVIALPVTVLGDWLSDQALSSAFSLPRRNRTKGPERSWLRIAYQVALYILFAICTVAVFYWLLTPTA
jgi:hypothetical protein